MRQAKFDPSDYPKWMLVQQKWWDNWAIRAKRAQDTLLASDKLPREFQSSIWRDLKTWLLENFFKGKCAYCEINVSGGFFGEGEHYRPKGSVRISRDGKLEPVLKPDGITAHGGYYWLAYDPNNLLPSCDKCNNRKSDQFPIRSDYVFDPPGSGIDIDALEQPLLVHPSRDDPSRHVRFGVAGTVAGVDEKGQHTVEVFGLNRAELAELRKARQEESRTHFGLALINRLLNGTAIDVTMEPFTGEKAQFSAAVGDFLQSQREILVKELQG